MIASYLMAVGALALWVYTGRALTMWADRMQASGNVTPAKTFAVIGLGILFFYVAVEAIRPAMIAILPPLLEVVLWKLP